MYPFFMYPQFYITFLIVLVLFIIGSINSIINGRFTDIAATNLFGIGIISIFGFIFICSCSEVAIEQEICKPTDILFNDGYIVAIIDNGVDKFEYFVSDKKSVVDAALAGKEINIFKKFGRNVYGGNIETYTPVLFVVDSEKDE